MLRAMEKSANPQLVRSKFSDAAARAVRVLMVRYVEFMLGEHLPMHVWRVLAQTAAEAILVGLPRMPRESQSCPPFVVGHAGAISTVRQTPDLCHRLFVVLVVWLSCTFVYLAVLDNTRSRTEVNSITIRSPGDESVIRLLMRQLEERVDFSHLVVNQTTGACQNQSGYGPRGCMTGVNMSVVASSLVIEMETVTSTRPERMFLTMLQVAVIFYCAATVASAMLLLGSIAQLTGQTADVSKFLAGALSTVALSAMSLAFQGGSIVQLTCGLLVLATLSAPVLVLVLRAASTKEQPINFIEHLGANNPGRCCTWIVLLVAVGLCVLTGYSTASLCG
jgi:hypothetical protein